MAWRGRAPYSQVSPSKIEERVILEDGQADCCGSAGCPWSTAQGDSAPSRSGRKSTVHRRWRCILGSRDGTGLAAGPSPSTRVLSDHKLFTVDWTGLGSVAVLGNVALVAFFGLGGCLLVARSELPSLALWALCGFLALGNWLYLATGSWPFVAAILLRNRSARSAVHSGTSSRRRGCLANAAERSP